MSKNPISVLLIDDNEDDNYFHKLILEECSLVGEVKITENSFEALTYLSSVTRFPDLIFLDINMPKKNGWEFMEEFGKLTNEMKFDSIIIILSTSLYPPDKKKALNTPGVKGFEVKPLSSSMLDMILQKYFFN